MLSVSNSLNFRKVCGVLCGLAESQMSKALLKFFEHLYAAKDLPRKFSQITGVSNVFDLPL